MKHGKSIQCVLLTALLIAGCASGTDPAADAKRALAVGDRRLVGYMGFGLVVPGTPAGFDPNSYAPGVRVMSDVSDAAGRDKIEKADSYAMQYNQTILRQTQ